MPSANKTPNYNLTQYSNNGSDKVSALQDYNADMSKIDTALNDNANNIITKADAADVTAKLATKADAADVTAKLATKADTATTYTKTDVDTKLGTKVDADVAVGMYNAVILGIDNSGQRDVSDDIQNLLNNCKFGIYFPSGKYLISKSLKIKTNGEYPFNVRCDPGATFITAESTLIDSFFELSNIAPSTPSYQYDTSCVFDGGVFLGNSRVNTAIKVTAIHACIKNCKIYDTVNSGIEANFISEIHDNYVWQKNTNSIGIDSNYDCDVYSNKIFYANIGIISGNNSRVHGNNIWSGMSSLKNTGIKVHNRDSSQVQNVMIYDNYLDTLNTAVDATEVYQFISIKNNLFFYSGTEGYNNLDYIGVKKDSNAHVSSIGNQFVSGSAHLVYGIVSNTNYDVSTAINNAGKDEYDTHRGKFSPLSENNIKDFYSAKNKMIQMPLQKDSSYCIGFVLSTQDTVSLYELSDGNGVTVTIKVNSVKAGILNGALLVAPWKNLRIDPTNYVQQKFSNSKYIPILIDSDVDAATTSGSLYLHKISGPGIMSNTFEKVFNKQDYM
jgi:hypothetical protein